MNVTLHQRVRSVRELQSIAAIIPKGTVGTVSLVSAGFALVKFERFAVHCAVDKKLGVDVEAVS